MPSTTRATRLGNIASIISTGVGNTTGMIIDGDTEQMACKYYPPTTSPITAIDWFLTVVGAGNTVNLQTEVQSDNGDAPSTTVLGGATAAFAGPATSNFTGAQSLASDTGALTLNVPVWLVLYRASGASLSGALSFQQSSTNTSTLAAGERQRHYNGANWTTTTPTNAATRVVVTHADGTICGFPITGSTANPSVTDIFGTNRQGLRFKAGSQMNVRGILLRITKTGSPADLVVQVYAGASLQYSNTVPAASIITNMGFPVYFSSPALQAADGNIYVILKQAGDGGTDANDYDLMGYPITSGYVAAMLPADMRFVSGTGDDPTALTVSTAFVPQLWPLVDDPAADLDMSGGGGGMIVHPGMGGGMRA